MKQIKLIFLFIILFIWKASTQISNFSIELQLLNNRFYEVKPKMEIEEFINNLLNIDKENIKKYFEYAALIRSHKRHIAFIVEDIKQFFKKNEKINIVSVGSGYALQEYLLIRVLLYLGYKFLDLNIIEPIMNPVENLKNILKENNFQECLDSTSKECNISIKHWNYGSDYISYAIKDAKETDVCMGFSVTSVRTENLNYPITTDLRLMTKSYKGINIILPFDIKNILITVDPTLDDSISIHFFNLLNKKLEKIHDSIKVKAITKFEDTKEPRLNNIIIDVIKETISELLATGIFENVVYNSNGEFSILDIIENTASSKCITYVAVKSILAISPLFFLKKVERKNGFLRISNGKDSPEIDTIRSIHAKGPIWKLDIDEIKFTKI